MDYRALGKSKVCPSGTKSLDWASIDEKMTKKKGKTYPIASLTGVGLKIRSRIRVKSTFPLRVRQGIVSNVPCSISRLLKKLD